MKFAFDGKEYALSFERKHKDVEIVRNGKKHTIKSQYPYTTVTLYERSTNAPIRVASATVGCIPSDSYSNERGRLAALRALNDVLTKRTFNTEDAKNKSKDFKRALWQAYNKRNVQPVKIVDATVVEPETVH